MQEIITVGLVKMFIAIGGFSVENFCVGAIFEPEIPKELKR